jgi:hypothetical protein
VEALAALLADERSLGASLQLAPVSIPLASSRSLNDHPVVPRALPTPFPLRMAASAGTVGQLCTEEDSGEARLRLLDLEAFFAIQSVAHREG